MALKKLSNQEQLDLTALVMDGITPQDIADKFNVSVSTVHNYKSILRQQGLKIPSVRGKRPTHEYTPATVPATAAQPTVLMGSFGGAPIDESVLPSAGDQQAQQPSHVTFTINGMTVEVDASASRVKVNQDGILIDF